MAVRGGALGMKKWGRSCCFLWIFCTFATVMNRLAQQLPPDFVAQTRDAMGAALWDDYVAALGEDAPVSIRLNPLKAGRLGVSEAMDDGGVAWCREGHYLRCRPAFTFDPLLHAGAYYVQEAASMFVSHVIRELVKVPVRMLDLCAAPGGKTTAARTALPQGSWLVSNEPVAKRANVLAENVQKWGAGQTIVTSSLPRDFSRAGELFDVILADVPCSGEGMFRKDEGAIGEWSLEGVKKCRLLQRDIVGEAWRCLVPGGLLIYSTCTYNVHENEENVVWMMSELGALPQDIHICKEWGIVPSLADGLAAPVFRFVPGRTRGEGLFMAVLRKGGDELRGRCTERGARLGKGLCTLFDGHRPPTVKGKDVIPDTWDALRADFDAARVATATLTYDEALRYLRRETLTLSPEVSRGIVAVTYRGLALGFVKNIGSRANNLYPAEWKIKSSHLPDEASAANILQ